MSLVSLEIPGSLAWEQESADMKAIAFKSKSIDSWKILKLPIRNDLDSKARETSTTRACRPGDAAKQCFPGYGLRHITSFVACSVSHSLKRKPGTVQTGTKPLVLKWRSVGRKRMRNVMIQHCEIRRHGDNVLGSENISRSWFGFLFLNLGSWYRDDEEIWNARVSWCIGRLLVHTETRLRKLLQTTMKGTWFPDVSVLRF